MTLNIDPSNLPKSLAELSDSESVVLVSTEANHILKYYKGAMDARNESKAIGTYRLVYLTIENAWNMDFSVDGPMDNTELYSDGHHKLCEIHEDLHLIEETCVEMGNFAYIIVSGPTDSLFLTIYFSGKLLRDK